MNKDVLRTLHHSWWSERESQRFESLSPVEALREIKTIVLQRFPGCPLTVIDRSCLLAIEKHSHRTQARSGRPETRHLLAVAWTIANLGLDPETVASALLHDVVEDTGVSVADLRQMFGHRVAGLVHAVSRLKAGTVQSYAKTERIVMPQVLDMLRNGLDELPSIFIKLAERLDHMRFSAPLLPFDQRQDIAREMIEEYAPIAEHLGIWELKALFEDLAFKYRNPDDYARITDQLESQYPCIVAFVHEMLPTLRFALDKAGIHALVEARVGHAYSTWEKMNRKRKLFADIHDLMGARVIVEQQCQCYTALSIVHRLWTPIKAEFDDYIARPKDNGYQSLHTTVISARGFPCDIQIRTENMHQVAEYGLLAHWRYKGTGNADEVLNAQFSALQRHLESIHRIREVNEYLKTWRTSLFRDQVHIYLSTGHLVSLPQAASAMDLVYAIGSEGGRKCVGARVGVVQVPLSYLLRTGDHVTILT